MKTPNHRDLIKRLQIMYVVAGVLAFISLALFFYGKINQVEANKQTKIATEKINQLEQCQQDLVREQKIAEMSAMEANLQHQRAEEALIKMSKK